MRKRLLSEETDALIIREVTYINAHEMNREAGQPRLERITSTKEKEEEPHDPH